MDQGLWVCGSSSGVYRSTDRPCHRCGPCHRWYRKPGLVVLTSMALTHSVIAGLKV